MDYRCGYGSNPWHPVVHIKIHGKWRSSRTHKPPKLPIPRHVFGPKKHPKGWPLPMAPVSTWGSIAKSSDGWPVAMEAGFVRRWFGRHFPNRKSTTTGESTIWLFSIAMENPLQMEVLMGKSSINKWAIFHGYVKLPEGIGMEILLLKLLNPKSGDPAVSPWSMTGDSCVGVRSRSHVGLGKCNDWGTPWRNSEDGEDLKKMSDDIWHPTVGGLEHEFYDLPYIGNNHPNWLSYMFSEG